MRQTFALNCLPSIVKPTGPSNPAVNKPVIVVGAGGHAKVVVDALLASDTAVIGLTDADQTKKDERLMGVSVLGGDDILANHQPAAVDLVLGVGSVRIAAIRQQLFEYFKMAGYQFRTLIHPSAVVGREVMLGEGCQIMAGAVIQAGAHLGANVLVNTRATIDHDCRIGDHVHVGPGAVLCASVNVGAGSHVGSGSTIIQGIRLGCAVQVGAGALIIRDCNDGTCHVGVPGKESKR